MQTKKTSFSKFVEFNQEDEEKQLKTKKLNPELLQAMKYQAALYAHSNGIVWLPKPVEEPLNFKFASFTLFPITLPLSMYKNFISSHKLISDLLQQILLNGLEWVLQISQEVGELDPFVKRLVGIAEKYLYEEELIQPYTFTIVRNDFMVSLKNCVCKNSQDENASLQLIQCNTISCGLLSMAKKVSNLHEYLHHTFPEAFPENSKVVNIGQQEVKNDENIGHINSNLDGYQVADALKDAFDVYFNQQKLDKQKDHAICIIIGQPNEKNAGDRYGVKLELYNRHKIKSKIFTLREVHDLCHYDEKTRKMYLKDEEIALFYFRSGYSQSDFHGEQEWIARERVQLSAAVKCPNILFHLLTLKRFQSELNKLEVLTKFIKPTNENFPQLRRIFCCFESLDEINQQSERFIRLAQKQPSNFVIKSSKQAGEGNIFDPKQISEILSAYPNNPEKLKQFMLMPKLNLPNRSAYMMRMGTAEFAITNDELSVFAAVGVDIKKKEKMINKDISLLVRTKDSSQEQGSFFRGAGMSSIWVYDDSNKTTNKEIDEKFYKAIWEY